MAIAIAERMRDAFPGARLAVSPRFGSIEDVRRHGFHLTLDFRERRLSRYGRLLRNVIQGRWREIVPVSDVDVVLDASGFAYSDQWGPGRARRLVESLSRPARKGQVLILLPQALGPFIQPEVVQWSTRLFSLADLVCARDAESHACVESLPGAFPLRKFPDFTVGVAPYSTAGTDMPSAFCAIVPNFRMLDKTSDAQAYVRFLQACIRSMRSRCLHPAFVLHDAEEDHRVLDLIGQDRDGIKVLTHRDPRVLKGILGQARFVVGSRFHALVSSLSQGVPCIGIGWSHKYQELFNDFRCPDLLVSDIEDRARFEAVMDCLSDDGERERLSSSILQSAREMKLQADAMWEAVEEIIRHRLPSRVPAGLPRKHC